MEGADADVRNHGDRAGRVVGGRAGVAGRWWLAAGCWSPAGPGPRSSKLCVEKPDIHEFCVLWEAVSADFSFKFLKILPGQRYSHAGNGRAGSAWRTIALETLLAARSLAAPAASRRTDDPVNADDSGASAIAFGGKVGVCFPPSSPFLQSVYSAERGA